MRRPDVPIGNFVGWHWQILVLSSVCLRLLTDRSETFEIYGDRSDDWVLGLLLVILIILHSFALRMSWASFELKW